MTSRLLLPVLISLSLLSQAVPAAPAESNEARDARMEWFRDARFGMFIHWGVYSVPAGEWKGKKYGGGVEWIQSKAKIPVSEYKPLKDTFNPVKYDPDAWVRLAKEAGMKYIVITSKHHDGFCLWDSAHTDWDIASTPYKKDLLKPLAEACRRHGLKLCFYHSIMDWYHPDYGNKAPWRGNAEKASPDMDAYTAYMKAQLKELLTNYGDVGIAWFDGEWESSWTHERGMDLDDYVRSLQPSIIVNNRVDKGRRGMEGLNKEGEFRGDYGTPEQQIPAQGLPGTDWESCMTMNGTWGYSAHDHKWKSHEKLIRNLIDIASKGGNYLLNVGPTAEGEIPAPSIERLKAIGTWMKTHGESVHGTQATPFSRTPWGRCTWKPLENGKSRIYLHLFEWPADGKITLSGLSNTITAASLLAAPESPIPVSKDKTGTPVLTLSGKNPDPVASVIAVDIEGTPKIKIIPVRAGKDGSLVLTAERATLEGNSFHLEDKGSERCVGFWAKIEDTLSFPVEFSRGGPHAAVLRWACAPIAAGARIEIRLLDTKNKVISTLPVNITDTGGWDKFITQPVGVLAVPAPGTYTLRIVPKSIKKEGVMNFARLLLKPTK